MRGVIGEEKDKPSAGGGKSKRWVKKPNGKPKFRAPTPGLETTVFNVGSTKDAANFNDVNQQLVRYCGVNFSRGADVVTKALEEQKSPVFTKPPDPADPDNAVQVKKMSIKLDACEKDKKVYEENKARAFNLYLLHCPRYLEDKIKALRRSGRQHGEHRM